MSELADDGIRVAVSLRVLKLSRAPYYRWLKNPVSATELEEAYRANLLFDAHRDDPQFGHRLLADEARDAGQSMCDRTAWKICSGNGWWSSFGKKKGKNGKKPGPPVHDDLVELRDARGRILVGEWLNEPIEVDRAGAVWRVDPETGDDVIDGTTFDRWLHGAIATRGCRDLQSG